MKGFITFWGCFIYLMWSNWKLTLIFVGSCAQRSIAAEQRLSCIRATGFVPLVALLLNMLWIASMTKEQTDLKAKQVC